MTKDKTIQFSIGDFSESNENITQEQILGKKKKATAKLVQDYLDDCKERLSAHTVKAHNTSLKAFEKFLGNVPLTNATKSDVRRFLNDLKHRGRARSTISGRFSNICSFFRYLGSFHNIIMPCLDDIDIEDYPKSRWEGQGQDALTRNEVRALMESPNNLRDILIIAMLYYLGLRVNELATLKVEDVDAVNRVVKVIGKGNKPRKIPYSSKLDRAIQKWLYHERRSYVSSNGAYFLPSKHGQRLSTKAIHEIVHNAAVDADIQEVLGKRADGRKIFKVHPHILRHSYANHAVCDDGIPLNLVQRMMGHSNISTTIRYAGELSAFGVYHEKFKGV